MNAPTAVTASGQYTAADLYKFSLTTLFRRFRFFAFIMVVVAVFALYSFFYVKQEFEWTVPHILGLAFPFLIFPYAFLVAPYFAAKKQMKKPLFSAVRTWSFSEAGLETAGPNYQAHLDWPAIIEVRETRSTLYLYTDKFLAHAIPRRFFCTPQDLVAVREMMSEHVAQFKPRND